jgi:hypothetical protein
VCHVLRLYWSNPRCINCQTQDKLNTKKKDFQKSGEPRAAGIMGDLKLPLPEKLYVNKVFYGWITMYYKEIKRIRRTY